jgi:diadenosine tetraphosphatase ApaH/serine/threonine PP2A family protein phosphatase
MRFAVISDIHANFAALEAVFAAIDTEAPDAIWCLGDVVGYGPRPNECCELVAARAALCLAGNHDLGIIGKRGLWEFSDDAAAAARWTQSILSEKSRTFLGGLSPQAEADGVELYHASPRDPVWEYVLSAEAARAALEATEAPLVLVGHSHAALALTLRLDEVEGGLAPSGAEIELEGRWLLNPGSVGQPRDGDPLAAYLLLDASVGSASFRRVAYDVERTQAEIRGLGLPEQLATRLATGE